MPPGDDDDGFTISYIDSLGDQFFIEGIGEDLVPTAVEQAIGDGGARKILIARQGDEDD
tara:strand:- start:346 stop:522 length:177 start_codon:yes stop_codon:yes gene_type:complete